MILLPKMDQVRIDHLCFLLGSSTPEKNCFKFKKKIDFLKLLVINYYNFLGQELRFPFSRIDLFVLPCFK